MSDINKRALREAAERAGQNDWEYVYTSDLSAPGRGYITVGGAEAIYCLNRATGGVKQSENVLRYIAAARPEKMLALLDELEAAEKRIAELEATQGKPVMFIDGDISPADADKLAAVIREFNEETETPAARMARIIRENPHPTNMCDMPAAAAGKGE
ncbi:ead/Ea22-like family protein [Escherichia coli]|nr:ead/Ea22-like family protein [Escherichia coli]